LGGWLFLSAYVTNAREKKKRKRGYVKRDLDTGKQEKEEIKSKKQGGGGPQKPKNLKKKSAGIEQEKSTTRGKGAEQSIHKRSGEES